VAQSGHRTHADECPLLGVKRTLRFQGAMSAFDAKWTSPNFDWTNSGGSMIMPERRARGS
jgi:hypothetical protein